MLLITHDLAVVADMAASRRADVRGPDHRGRRGRRLLRRARSTRTRALLLRALPDARAARRVAAGDPRHGAAAADSAVRRLPLRAALRPRVRRAARPTLPALDGARAARSVRCLLYAVRCLLYAPGAPTHRPRARRPASRRRRRRRHARRAAPATRCCDVREPARALPDPRAACCSAASGFFNAVDGISFDVAARRDAGAGRRVGLRQDDHRQGDRAAAARHRHRSRAARVLAGQDLFDLRGEALRAGAARHPDHLPGSVRVAQSAHARARHPRRGPAARCARRWTPARAASASRRWSSRWACAATRSTAIRTSSPAASASASRSRARWRCSPG